MLQQQIDQTRLAYKIKRTEVIAAVRQARHEVWNRLIATIEHDVYRRQILAYLQTVETSE